MAASEMQQLSDAFDRARLSAQEQLQGRGFGNDRYLRDSLYQAMNQLGAQQNCYVAGLGAGLGAGFDFSPKQSKEELEAIYQEAALKDRLVEERLDGTRYIGMAFNRAIVQDPIPFCGKPFLLPVRGSWWRRLAKWMVSV